MPDEIRFTLKTEYITLGQLLKAAGIASTGGEAREMLAAAGILVNGEPENRRGKKLRKGDRVVLADGSSVAID